MNCSKIHPVYETRCQLAAGHLPQCKFPRMTQAAIDAAEAMHADIARMKEQHEHGQKVKSKR